MVYGRYNIWIPREMISVLVYYLCAKPLSWSSRVVYLNEVKHTYYIGSLYLLLLAPSLIPSLLKNVLHI